jgi:hypothetical protein
MNNVSCVRCRAASISSSSSFGADVYGGAISALFIGAYAWSVGFASGYENSESGDAEVGNIFVQDSQMFLTSSMFENCVALSFTSGSGSLDSSAVFGGAVALTQSPQVFPGLQLSRSSPTNNSSFNLSATISNAKFVNCLATTFSSDVPPNSALGSGGSVFVKSPALFDFALKNSSFNSCHVQVLSGTIEQVLAQVDIPTSFDSSSTNLTESATPYSSGGALAIDASGSGWFTMEISFTTFFNCSAQGANASNLAVRGGAVAVSNAASIVVKHTDFIKGRISDAVRGSSVNGIVSGGAGLIVTLSQNVIIQHCVFDSTNSQDSSETSTGLLVLATIFSHTRLYVEGCSFVSTAAVFRYSCVDINGIRASACTSSGTAFINVAHSSVRQLQNENDKGPSQVQLMSFGKGVPLIFSKFFMSCLTTSAIFKHASESNNEYLCGTCPSFHISVTGSEVQLENLSAKKETPCVSVSTLNSRSCPLGISDCTTFVKVKSGFWTNFTSFTDFSVFQVSRCPRSYCGCDSRDSCRLEPPMTVGSKLDPLCNGNRTGKLCGGCPTDFTQSLNSKSCISNSSCTRNLWWVWTLTIASYAVYSLYIALSSRRNGDGAMSCLLFYFQVSSFATNPEESDVSVAILEFSQVRSMLATHQDACYAPNMTAYNAIAFHVVGPIIVFAFTAAWTCIIQAFQKRLQDFGIETSVSISGALALASLLIFSNITHVVFTLVECSSYDNDGVVFIDGTVPCKNSVWYALMVVACLLCLCPLAFALALHLRKFPQSAREAVCGKFIDSAFYWGAVTMTFRLMMSVSQFLRVDYPNLMACVRLSLSVGLLVWLVFLRPYAHLRTFWVDVTCYVCLILQFSLQTIEATREYLGVVTFTGTAGFFSSLTTSSTVIRFASWLSSLSILSHNLIYILIAALQVFACCCCCHYLVDGRKSTSIL